MPERMLSDKLPRVNARSSTGWFGAETEGEIGIESGVIVDGSVERLKDWGKSKENSRAKDFWESDKQQC